MSEASGSNNDIVSKRERGLELLQLDANETNLDVKFLEYVSSGNCAGVLIMLFYIFDLDQDEFGVDVERMLLDSFTLAATHDRSSYEMVRILMENISNPRYLSNKTFPIGHQDGDVNLRIPLAPCDLILSFAYHYIFYGNVEPHFQVNDHDPGPFQIVKHLLDKGIRFNMQQWYREKYCTPEEIFEQFNYAGKQTPFYHLMRDCRLAFEACQVDDQAAAKDLLVKGREYTLPAYKAAPCFFRIVVSPNIVNGQQMKGPNGQVLVERGDTLLHVAVRYNCINITKILIKAHIKRLKEDLHLDEFSFRSTCEDFEALPQSVFSRTIQFNRKTPDNVLEVRNDADQSVWDVWRYPEYLSKPDQEICGQLEQYQNLYTQLVQQQEAKPIPRGIVSLLPHAEDVMDQFLAIERARIEEERRIAWEKQERERELAHMEIADYESRIIRDAELSTELRERRCMERAERHTIKADMFERAAVKRERLDMIAAAQWHMDFKFHEQKREQRELQHMRKAEKEMKQFLLFEYNKQEEERKKMEIEEDYMRKVLAYQNAALYREQNAMLAADAEARAVIQAEKDLQNFEIACMQQAEEHTLLAIQYERDLEAFENSQMAIADQESYQMENWEKFKEEQERQWMEKAEKETRDYEFFLANAAKIENEWMEESEREMRNFIAWENESKKGILKKHLFAKWKYARKAIEFSYVLFRSIARERLALSHEDAHSKRFQHKWATDHFLRKTKDVRPDSRQLLNRENKRFKYYDPNAPDDEIKVTFITPELLQMLKMKKAAAQKRVAERKAFEEEQERSRAEIGLTKEDEENLESRESLLLEKMDKESRDIHKFQKRFKIAPVPPKFWFSETDRKNEANELIWMADMEKESLEIHKFQKRFKIKPVASAYTNLSELWREERELTTMIINDAESLETEKFKRRFKIKY